MKGACGFRESNGQYLEPIIKLTLSSNSDLTVPIKPVAMLKSGILGCYIMKCVKN